ncbi:heavy metal-associated isoprenylated plant protein 2-like [Panicum virgatum]|uniref:heavy metal-associated isoprenylated plant protein 2-like n=1 Tax=Panicum virgatum TaxID=38727 RepID=UPI0019D67D96|nr:heavy metal-associated isoprenylated plant protein 2-like [Panicum virgatum]
MYLQKTVIRADLVGSSCKMAILSTVAKLEEPFSSSENCTLTVVGAVDPVAIVLELKKACLVAAIVSVEDDKPKDPEPEPVEPPKVDDDEDPCRCRDEECCVQACQKGCVPGLCYCCYYTAFRPAPYGYGWHW